MEFVYRTVPMDAQNRTRNPSFATRHPSWWNRVYYKVGIRCMCYYDAVYRVSCIETTGDGETIELGMWVYTWRCRGRHSGTLGYGMYVQYYRLFRFQLNALQSIDYRANKKKVGYLSTYLLH